jgi:hypothetical protein
MKKLFIALLLLIPVAAIASPSAEIMAEILIELNHFPTAEDQEFLDEILADAAASEEEKTLAAAIKRIQHKPADADLAMLQELKDGGSSDAVRTLAAAVLSINHQVSEQSSASLSDLLDQLELARE